MQGLQEIVTANREASGEHPALTRELNAWMDNVDDDKALDRAIALVQIIRAKIAARGLLS